MICMVASHVAEWASTGRVANPFRGELKPWSSLRISSREPGSAVPVCPTHPTEILIVVRSRCWLLCVLI